MRREIFQATGGRVIIDLIALQGMISTAVAGNFNSTRQAVSKHLCILTECKLVKREQ